MYGYIQTASNVAKQLKRLNKDYEGRSTWGNLYSSADLQRQSALSKLNYDYSSEIADAYATAYKQNAAVANSALGSGFKNDTEMNMDSALQEAFNSYRQRYLTSASEIEDNALQMTGQVDTLLQQEAQNYVDYEAATYKYLKYLYEGAYPNEDADYEADSDLVKLFTENPAWSKYIVTEKDEAGKDVPRLMTEQELRSRNYDWSDDGVGTLNKSGVDFYDQMINQLSSEKSPYGFHAWLSATNPKLYEWSQTPNQYNYTEAGTNAGTFKELVGLKSTDNEYDIISNFAGITKEDVKQNISEMNTSLENILNDGLEGNTKNALTEYTKALDNISTYIAGLPLSSEDLASVTAEIDALRTEISNATANIHNTDDWLTWAETSEAWRYERNKGQTGSAVVEAVGTFLGGFVTDVVQTIFPKTTDAVDNLRAKKGRDSVANERNDASSGRKRANKEIIDNISKNYLDLLTYISQFAK